MINPLSVTVRILCYVYRLHSLIVLRARGINVDGQPLLSKSHCSKGLAFFYLFGGDLYAESAARSTIYAIPSRYRIVGMVIVRIDFTNVIRDIFNE